MVFVGCIVYRSMGIQSRKLTTWYFNGTSFPFFATLPQRSMTYWSALPVQSQCGPVDVCTEGSTVNTYTQGVHNLTYNQHLGHGIL